MTWLETDLNTRQTVILAILVLFLGKWLNQKIPFTRKYNIPEPVTGGVVASLIFGILYFAFGVQCSFSLEVRDVLLIVFFTCIGLSSSFTTLIEGGKSLLILLVAAISYLLLQNVTGISVASTLGMPSQTGLLGGSVSLAGGHGTAIAWSPIFAKEYGIANASEIGIACATFGLILGGVLGGPLAQFLIQKFKLSADSGENITVGVKHDKEESTPIMVNNMLSAILVVCLAVGLGTRLMAYSEDLGLALPPFVLCLFGGILLANLGPKILPKMNWTGGDSAALALISELSLGLFLSMSLMSLELWTLLDLAGPILAILLAQTILALLFAGVIVFWLMGKSYEAAVISSGFVGLGLGATPTAIANMTAVAKKFGAAPHAFIVVPLVGAFFIDISNALIIQTLLNWLAG